MAVTAITAATGAGITAGALATDITLAGAGLTALTQYQAGKEQQASYKYNAAIAEQQAKREEYTAKYEADLRRERGRKYLASQRVGFASSGVSLEGTPLLVINETAKNISQDVAMTLWNGRQRGDYYRSQASMSRMYGKSAYRAGLFGAGTSLLTGAFNAFGNYTG